MTALELYWFVGTQGEEMKQLRVDTQGEVCYSQMVGIWGDMSRQYPTIGEVGDSWEGPKRRVEKGLVESRR